ncbi:hypothetical protein GH714_027421 [Hevea brasiliensis]|uniref:SHSP domain-containing protein n=1 Tax=Hevea brasiliensis TaxID=3981 RepID=A0A6A6MHD8_HEVBR|nr:hypothetical protein GH714_027421 [Hevea brasiliensis]
MAMIPSFFGDLRSSIFDPFSSFDLGDPFKDFQFPSSSLITSGENSAFVNTRIDWKETPEAHFFKADLPGLKKEEVKVEIEDDRVLQISGERNVEKEDKNDTWHRVERSSGKFLRRFRLPENAKMNERSTMAMIPSFFGDRRSSIFDPFNSFDLWDPFKDFSFPSSFSIISRENSAFVNTCIDWKETQEAHVFKADLPGLKKEEVKVEIEDDRVLQISGERNVEKEDKNDAWHRVERSSGKFLRRFRLPENAKMDQVKASMENGVLTVNVPKEEVKKPDVKAIEISG